MLFVSANLAAQYPDHLGKLFLGVFLGAYLSDLIAYSLGRKFGPKLQKIKIFANSFQPRKIDKIKSYYEKYGVITLILGRFIPFGVRNALFMTAGLSKMRFFKFASSDLLACTISVSTFFSLYYYIGPSVIHYVKRFNILIFLIFVIIVLILILKYKKR